MEIIKLKKSKFTKHAKEYANLYKKELNYCFTEDGKKYVNITENPINLAFFENVYTIVNLINNDLEIKEYIESLDESVQTVLNTLAIFMEPEYRDIIRKTIAKIEDEIEFDRIVKTYTRNR